MNLYNVTFPSAGTIWIWADDESSVKRHISRHYAGNVAYTITGEHPHEEDEQDIVEEARAIADGAIDKTPTKEHLCVLLKWLDGGTR